MLRNRTSSQGATLGPTSILLKASGGDRTHDISFTKAALYQLSYGSILKQNLFTILKALRVLPALAAGGISWRQGVAKLRW
jgi:hypothetical protein